MQNLTHDSEDEIFSDAVENGEWHDAPADMVFNEFDDSLSGPKHDLPATASALDFFSLFWTMELINLIVAETNRYKFANVYPT